MAQSIFTSTGGGGNWTSASSWSENNQGNPSDSDGIPDGNDNVIITSGNPITIATATGQNVEDLTLTDGSLTFTISGSDLDIEGNLLVNGSATSTLTASSDFATDPRIDLTGTFTINTSATASIGQIRFDANNTTTINGTIAFSTTVGAKIFTDIILASTGTWDNSTVAEDFNIDGDITQNGGTWNGCSNNTGCNYVMRATSSTISGTGTVNVSDLVVNTTDACTNNGNLTVTDDIRGTGSFTNSATGTVTFSQNAEANITTLTLNTVGSNVIYSGSSTQNMVAAAHYDVEINMGTSTTLCRMNGNNVTIDNNLTITQGRTQLQSANTMSVGGDISITTNGELEPNNASAVLNVTGDISMTGGIYDHNNGDVNITDDFLISGGTFTYTGTSTLDADQFTVENCTMVLSGGTVTATNAVGTGITLNAAGLIDINAATLNVTNDLSIANATAELNPDNASTVVNISGDLLMSAGNYNQDAGDVNITGDFTITGGTFNMSGASSTLDMDQMTITNSTATLANGIMNVNNASATGITLNATGVIIHNGATLNVAHDLSIANATAEYSPNNTGAVSNISGDLLMSAGLFDHNNGDVNVTGNITLTGGTMTMDENGATSTIDATDMAITNATATLNEGILTISNASGGITINGGGQLTGNNTSTLSVANNVTISGGEYSPNNANHTGTINGDIILSSGIYDHNNGAVTATDMTVSSGTAAISGGTLNITNASGGLNVSGGLVNINGAHTLTVANDVTISGTGEFQPNNSEMVANISGNLSMSNGTFDHNDGDLNITGDILITGGTMTMNEGTTPVNPSTIDATDMSVQTGSVTLSEGTLTLSNAAGGLSVSNSGSVLINNAAHTLSISGDFDVDGTGSADVNSGTLNFVNMDVTGGGTVNIASPTITSTGTITVDNGTYTSDGAGGTYSYANITVNTNGTWNVTAAYDPTISGNLFNDGSFTGCNGAGCNYTLTSTSGTISGSGAMNTMSDFILNDGASYTNTNSGGLDISDRLATTSGTGTFVNGANGVMSYGGTTGNFSVTNFTASANPNTVIYNRTASNQAIETTTDNQYHNLTINKADGIDVTTTAVLTINGTLTLTAGDLIMGGQNLIMADGATISGGSSTSYIQDNGAGALRQVYSAAGATLSFPIGDADDYSPINSFTINSATFGASPYLEFSITDANHPNRDTNNTGAGGDDDGTAATDFISRYWTVAPNDITAPRYDATYTYVDADITGTEANMVGTVYRTPPGQAFLDWHVGGTVNSTSNTVSISNIDAFGDLYAMDNTLARLPIVLISFEARVIENAVELEWVTATEENNEFFTIERSIDGKNFFPVIEVNGAGNSSELITYTARDENPLYGRSFYRLKQTDFTGEFEYSEIRSVFYEGVTEALNFNVYPNPARVTDEITVVLPGNFINSNLILKLADTSGNAIGSSYTIRDNALKLNMKSLKRGLYILQLTDGTRTASKKIIVR